MRLLTRQISPYTRISPRHPLFKIESRPIRRLLRSYRLFQKSMTLIAIIFAIALFFWVLAVNADTRGRYNTGVSQLMTLLLVVSLGANGFLDFACMVASVNSFAGEFTAGRWDLLRMTPLVAEEIAAVKYTAARLRVWRMTTLVFSLRLTTLILGLFTWLLDDGLNGFRIDSLDDFEALVAIGLLVLIYVIEPFWRAGTFTAVGLVISMRLRSGLSLTLASIGAVLTLWIVQPIVIGIIFWVSGTTVAPLLVSVNNPTLGGIALLLSCIYIVAVFYGFYAAVKKFAFDTLTRWIDRIEA